ncbi:peptidoglycan-binding domain-containing protein [Streptomyces sp. ME19-03-3]|nr:peptidoglycan-binding domain-containing protein [Streptomyces sp. ME19-03-3]
MASDAPGSPASQEHEYESLRVRPYVPGPEDYADAQEPVPADVAAGAAEAFPSQDGGPPTAVLPPVAPQRAAGAAGREADTDLIDLGTVSSDRPPLPAAAVSGEPGPHPSRAEGRRRAGAHRRRRGGLIAGAAVAAAGLAVGAVLVTAQLTGRPDRTEAAPDQGASEPAVELPSSARPSASASRSAPPSAGSSASVSASASASARVSASATASATTGTTGGPTPGVSASRPTASAGGQVSQTPGSAPPAVPATLQRGDTGPAVVDLQNRLKAVRLYYGPSDGDYSRKVGDAVARFQFFYGVKGDPQGVYGPHTRAALESRTGATPDRGADNGN